MTHYTQLGNYTEYKQQTIQITFEALDEIINALSKLKDQIKNLSLNKLNNEMLERTNT